jgi:hypothetical protein
MALKWKEGEMLKENELVLSLCKGKVVENHRSENDQIKAFREKYRDQSVLITKATQGDSKALRQLRWQCGLKVII